MNLRNAKYVHNSWIDCEIEHPQFGWIPHTASPDDPDTQQIYARIINGEAGPIAAADPIDLDLLKRNVESEIDSAATQARRRYVSPDKDATYKSKQDEVARWIADGRPSAPAAGTYPYIELEAQFTGLSVTAVGDSVELAVQQWTQLDPYIEAISRSAKVKILASTDPVEIQTIVTQHVTQLDQI